jgi:hypothetical protein
MDSNFQFRAEIGFDFGLPNGRRCGAACCPGSHAGSP